MPGPRAVWCLLFALVRPPPAATLGTLVEKQEQPELEHPISKASGGPDIIFILRVLQSLKTSFTPLY